jgi:hypothetical protein
LSKQFDNNNNNVAVQRRFSVNVWCGILGDSIYYQNEISNFLDEILLAVVNSVVFDQDGAIPYNARMNFVFLNHLNHFRER